MMPATPELKARRRHERRRPLQKNRRWKGGVTEFQWWKKVIEGA